MTECLKTKFSRRSRVIKAVITRVLYLVESYVSHVQTSHHNAVNRPDHRPEATPRPLTYDKPGPGGRRTSPAHFYLALCTRGCRSPGPVAGTWLSREGPEAGWVLTAAAFGTWLSRGAEPIWIWQCFPLRNSNAIWFHTFCFQFYN